MRGTPATRVRERVNVVELLAGVDFPVGGFGSCGCVVAAGHELRPKLVPSSNNTAARPEATNRKINAGK